ncbi:MAG: SDR family NAD(P)-dependent oxidoreductase [Deltaproteobacteria bacterium]|nr:SDR family NAD(P)-dependent oxidoreductase [Deltaproteobacteria bacterium]
MQDFGLQYGPWALVTGAESGIGQEFACQLGKHGMNLILVSEETTQVEMMSERLAHHFGVKTMVVSADLSNPQASSKIIKQVEGKEIGFLVPNAGMEAHGDFIQEDPLEEMRLLQNNIVGPLQLTRHFAGKMSERGRGGIIFIASTFGFGAAPYLANYAASMAYILTLGESLHYELKKDGVDVSVLSPGVNHDFENNSKMNSGNGSKPIDIKKSYMPATELIAAVQTGLSCLGKKPTIIPGLFNKTFTFMEKHLMSRRACMSFMGHMFEKALNSEH